MKLWIMLAVVAGLAGCTTFKAEMKQDGTLLIGSNGAPLLSRKTNFEAKHEWLDENNVLHIVSVKQNTDEKADAQAEVAKEAMKYAFQAGAAGAAVTPLSP
ncbi:MAG: hypothetical protein KKD77_20710 [Gammaproteobacteria bacterium]|nr:hypothetical protein [Gammaproteobacteria bacterium]